MSSQPIKNVMVVGASGTIGAPIVSALLSDGRFEVSVLSRAESVAKFPSSTNVVKVDLNSYADLVKALEGQDALICTLNDDASGVQVQLIEASFEAGIRRFVPSEWGSSDIKASTKEMEVITAGKITILAQLAQTCKKAKASGKEFHWTGVNCGVFFDWSLHTSFLDISLPPTINATIWDEGTNLFSATNLTTVAKAVISALTFREVETRDRFIYVESFTVSQKSIINALERTTAEKWNIEVTTTAQQLAIAQVNFEQGRHVEAFYVWIRAGLFSGGCGCRFQETILDNDLLGLQKEDLDGAVGRIVREEKI